MKSYRSRSGKISGVTAYKIQDKAIIVEFNRKVKYLYSYESAGRAAVEEMKSLATQSIGLSTFITQQKPSYSEKY